jgi:hypothetical protein
MIDTRYRLQPGYPYDEDVNSRAAIVFRNTLEELVRTFSVNFDKSKEPEKRRLVERVVGAIYVLAWLLETSNVPKEKHLHKPADDVFMDAFQTIPQKYKVQWNAMMSDCEKYLAEVGLDKASKQIVDFNRKFVSNVVGIAKSGTSGGATKKPTKFEVEDNEEETDTSVSPRTLSLVQAVNDGRGIPLERFQQLMSNLNI